MKIVTAACSAVTIFAFNELPVEMSGQLPMIKGVMIQGQSLNLVLDTSSSILSVFAKNATGLNNGFDYPKECPKDECCVCQTSSVCGEDQDFTCKCIPQLNPGDVLQPSTSVRAIRDGILTREFKAYIRAKAEFEDKNGKVSAIVPLDYVKDTSPSLIAKRFVNRFVTPIDGFFGIAGELSNCRSREPSFWRRILDSWGLSKIPAPEIDTPKLTDHKNRPLWAMSNVTDLASLTLHLSHETGPKVRVGSTLQEDEKEFEVVFQSAFSIPPFHKMDSDIAFSIYYPSACSRDPEPKKALLASDSDKEISEETDKIELMIDDASLLSNIVDGHVSEENLNAQLAERKRKHERVIEILKEFKRQSEQLEAEHELDGEGENEKENSHELDSQLIDDVLSRLYEFDFLESSSASSHDEIEEASSLLFSSPSEMGENQRKKKLLHLNNIHSLLSSLLEKNDLLHQSASESHLQNGEGINLKLEDVDRRSPRLASNVAGMESSLAFTPSSGDKMSVWEEEKKIVDAEDDDDLFHPFNQRRLKTSQVVVDLESNSGDDHTTRRLNSIEQVSGVSQAQQESEQPTVARNRNRSLNRSNQTINGNSNSVRNSVKLDLFALRDLLPPPPKPQSVDYFNQIVVRRKKDAESTLETVSSDNSSEESAAPSSDSSPLSAKFLASKGVFLSSNQEATLLGTVEEEEAKGREGYETGDPWRSFNDEYASLLGMDSQTWQVKVRTTERCLVLPGSMWESLVNRIDSKYITCDEGRRWKLDIAREDTTPSMKPRLCRVKMYDDRPPLPSFTFALKPPTKGVPIAEREYLRVPLESLLLDAEDDDMPNDKNESVKPFFFDEKLQKNIPLRALCVIGAHPSLYTREMILPTDDNPSILFGAMVLKSLILRYDPSKRQVSLAASKKLDSTPSFVYSDGTCALPLACPGSMRWSKSTNTCNPPSCSDRIFTYFNEKSKQCEMQPMFVYGITLVVVVLSYMHVAISLHSWKSLIMPALERHRAQTE
eukprot:GDKJ01056533.1.p1 GENE.GDKJ01056533.1~~GDKJ01056533.1.p1  ORF type:complete len:1013 (-),score=252.54 GDKJ01056533.1:211-3219(-)